MNCTRLQCYVVWLLCSVSALLSAPLRVEFVIEGAGVNSSAWAAVYDGPTLVAWSGYGAGNGWVWEGDSSDITKAEANGGSGPIRSSVCDVSTWGSCRKWYWNNPGSGLYCGSGNLLFYLAGDSCGSPAPTYEFWSFDECITNRSPFLQEYRFSVTPSVGAATQTQFALNPGEIRCITEVQTNSFTYSLQVRTCMEVDFNCEWEGDAFSSPDHWEDQEEPGVPESTAETTAGNIHESQDSEERLGQQAPITGNLTNRVDISSSTGDALQREKDTNDENRHAELRSLLIAQDSAEARRDTMALDAFNRGIAQLSALEVGHALSTSNMLVGLAGALTNGVTGDMGLTNGAGTIIATNLGGFAFDGYASSLTNLLPGVTVPSEPDVAFEIPLTALHEDLEPVELDFAHEDLAPVITLIRNFFLFVVTVGFFYGSARLVGRAAGV